MRIACSKKPLLKTGIFNMPTCKRRMEVKLNSDPRIPIPIDSIDVVGISR